MYTLLVSRERSISFLTLTVSVVRILIVSPDLPVTMVLKMLLLSSLTNNLYEPTKIAMMINADQIRLNAIQV